MATQELNEQPTLRTLYRPPGYLSNESVEVAVVIVVIPETGTQSASSWSDGSSCWLKTLLPDVIQNVLVVEYYHDVPVYRDFAWQHLAEKGDTLLEQLLRRTSDLKYKAIEFIAHGFGGLILKRALSTMFERFYDPIFRQVILSMTGVVFLGSPHVTWSKTKSWESLPLLLRACLKGSKKKAKTTWGDASTVVSISQKFADLQVEVPILSIFEQKTTKAGGSVFSGKKEVAVEKSFAEIGAKNEVLLGADVAHMDLCNLNRSKSHFKNIEEFLVLNATRLNDTPVTQSLSQQESHVLWEGSETTGVDEQPRDKVKEALVLSPSKGSPANATGGSSDIASYEMIPRKPVTYNSRKEANVPCFLMRPHVQNPDFVGRGAVFDALDEALLPRSDNEFGGSSLKTFALCSMGGVGKTQTSVEYAYSRRDKFDAVFLINASESAKLAIGYTQISQKLGLEDAASVGDQVVSRDLVLEWFSRPLRHHSNPHGHEQQNAGEEAKWLLVLDNADDLNLLVDYWPVTGSGSILVTSRDPLAKTQSYVYSPKGMDLECLSTAESAAMLQTLTGYKTSEDEETATAIGKRLGGLPLAITQVASTILRRSLSFEEFLRFWEKDTMRRGLYPKDTGDQGKNIYTTWAFEDLSSEGQCLVDMLSFMDPDRIQESILDVGHSPEDLAGLELQDYPNNALSFIDARTELAKSSLVRRNIKLKEVSIHRLVQDAARTRMTSERRTIVVRGVVELLFRAWPFGIFDYNTVRWQTCELIFPHICFLMSHVQPSDKSNLGNVRVKFAKLLTDAGWYYLERGNVLESLPFQEMAQKLLDPSDSTEMIILADIHFCQAEVHIYTANAAKGLPHAEETWKIMQSHDKPDYRLPQSHNEMCEALLHLERFDEAIEHAESAATGYFALNDPEHYPFFSLYMKAFCYWRQEKNTDAAQVLEELLEWRYKTYGLNDTESFKTGLAMLTLGNVRESQGRLEEALDLHLKAYDQYTVTLGVTHYRFAALSAKLGGHYARVGRLGDARDMFLQAMKIYGDRPYHIAEVTLVSIELAHVLSLLGPEEDYVVTKKRSVANLEALNQGRTEKLMEADVERVVAPWSL
ncbi:hypothetical protein BDV96DRAFT_642115 [Lophiotrema nucula]|uniref:DUF7779 domain-containing protein n=1 Tax=Lophiotrema nucula TaxID=690887 RepID=A0A6A5ZN23_9PLEO|nr:hypothetical protein BDV96DRAFT_642115 [Lophiotrema nucula]